MTKPASPNRRLRLPKERFIGTSPSGVQYVARYLGEEALLRSSLQRQWAAHNARLEREARRSRPPTDDAWLDEWGPRLDEAVRQSGC